MTTVYPWEITDVEPDVARQVMDVYTGNDTGYIRVGPKGYFLPNEFKEDAANIFHMDVRPNDVFVVSYPRSGTTWTQELVWMIENELDYAKSNAVPLVDRFPFLEYTMLLHEGMRNKLRTENKDSESKLKLTEWVIRSGVEYLDQMTTQRFVKTHLPMSLLPPNLLDTAKVVYVARDPRDVVVSFYHFNCNIEARRYLGDLKSFWNLFIRDLQYWTPYFDHLKEAWEKRYHPNMLFLFYEELSKDLPATIRRVSRFFNKEYSEEQIAGLCEHLNIDNFKRNKSVNYEFNKLKELNIMDEVQKFVRQGKAGNWRDCFDDEMTAEAEKWIADNLRDTDLRFCSNLTTY